MQGWRCPGCSRCFAPHISECSYCTPSYGTFGTGNFFFYPPVTICVHDYDEPDTAGRRCCKKCRVCSPEHEIYILPESAT